MHNFGHRFIHHRDINLHVRQIHQIVESTRRNLCDLVVVELSIESKRKRENSRNERMDFVPALNRLCSTNYAYSKKMKNWWIFLTRYSNDFTNCFYHAINEFDMSEEFVARNRTDNRGAL